MSDRRRDAVEDIINIYHEILLNEIAIMRFNTIVEEGVNIGDSIAYYHNMHPLQSSVKPNTSRGLDYIVLAYAVFNGVRRIVCGYNILKPIDPEPKCDVNEIRSKIQEILRELSKTPIENNYSLEQLIAKLVIVMINHGLLFIVPKWSQDNLSIITTMEKTSMSKQSKHVIEVGSFQDFHSLIIMEKLERFFGVYGIELSR